MPNINENLMNHFLRGFYDGDGCICVDKNNRVTISVTGYLPFLNEIKEYLSKNNINGNFYKDKELVGEFCIGANIEVKKILEYLYKDATLFLERKYQKYLDSMNILNNKLGN